MGNQKLGSLTRVREGRQQEKDRDEKLISIPTITRVEFREHTSMGWPSSPTTQGGERTVLGSPPCCAAPSGSL
jgi:hypothetical protein